jgi:hypothetical protein
VVNGYTDGAGTDRVKHARGLIAFAVFCADYDALFETDLVFDFVHFHRLCSYGQPIRWSEVVMMYATGLISLHVWFILALTSPAGITISPTI